MSDLWVCEKSKGNVHVAPDNVTNGKESFLAYGATDLCAKLNELENQRTRLKAELLAGLKKLKRWKGFDNTDLLMESDVYELVEKIVC